MLLLRYLWTQKVLSFISFITLGQGGHLKAVKSSSETNAVITTAVMADLPVLAKMLSNLFESSCSLSEQSLHHLVDALIVISGESLQLAYNNRLANINHLKYYYGKRNILMKDKLTYTIYY